MSKVIDFYAVWCICIFAIVFSYDTELIWYDLDFQSKNIKIRMPKLSDLLYSNDLICQKYAEKIIAPAYYYFRLRDDLDKKQNVDDFESAGVTFVLRIMPIFAFMDLLIKSEPDWNKWMIVAISVVVGIITNVLIELIYKRTKLKLGKCPFSMKYITETAKSIVLYGDDNFNISEESKLNNFFIEMHYGYLREVKEKIYFRYYVRKIIIGIGAVVYLLFFGIREP